MLSVRDEARSRVARKMFADAAKLAKTPGQDRAYWLRIADQWLDVWLNAKGRD